MTRSISICILLIVIAITNAADHVHYKFEYGVDDPHTKDHKNHFEHRDGDYIIGRYTLKEADGTHRVVKYKSGPKSGFEAVVEQVGHAQHDEGHGYGGHREQGGGGGHGGTSYVGTTHWGNQGGKDGH